MFLVSRRESEAPGSEAICPNSQRGIVEKITRFVKKRGRVVFDDSEDKREFFRRHETVEK